MFYHQKDQSNQLLEVISSKIVTRAKQIIAEEILSESNEKVLIDSNHCFFFLSL